MMHGSVDNSAPKVKVDWSRSVELNSPRHKTRPRHDSLSCSLDSASDLYKGELDENVEEDGQTVTFSSRIQLLRRGAAPQRNQGNSSSNVLWKKEKDAKLWDFLESIWQGTGNKHPTAGQTVLHNSLRGVTRKGNSSSVFSFTGNGVGSDDGNEDTRLIEGHHRQDDSETSDVEDILENDLHNGPPYSGKKSSNMDNFKHGHDLDLDNGTGPLSHWTVFANDVSPNSEDNKSTTTKTYGAGRFDAMGGSTLPSNVIRMRRNEEDMPPPLPSTLPPPLHQEKIGYDHVGISSNGDNGITYNSYNTNSPDEIYKVEKKSLLPNLSEKLPSYRSDSSLLNVGALPPKPPRRKQNLAPRVEGVPLPDQIQRSHHHRLSDDSNLHAITGVQNDNLPPTAENLTDADFDTGFDHDILADTLTVNADGPRDSNREVWRQNPVYDDYGISNMELGHNTGKRLPAVGGMTMHYGSNSYGMSDGGSQSKIASSGSFDGTGFDHSRWQRHEKTFEESANEPWDTQNVDSRQIYGNPYQGHQSTYDYEVEARQNLPHNEIMKYPYESSLLGAPPMASNQTGYGQQHYGTANYGDMSNTQAAGVVNSSRDLEHYEEEEEYLSGRYIKACGQCPHCKQREMMRTMEALVCNTGLVIHDVLPDGNCMFRSIIDQLRMHGELGVTARLLRQRTVDHLRLNPHSEDGTHLKEFLLTEAWEEYLQRMERDGEWGDEITLRGVSEVLQRRIRILSAVGKQHNQITIQPSGVESDQSADLSLGHLNDSHYFSLRPKDWLDKWYINARFVKKSQTDSAGDQDEATRKKYARTDFTSIKTSEQMSFTESKTPADKIDDKESEALLLDDKILIDKVSMTPLYHLSFVMKSVLNATNLKPVNTCHQEHIASKSPLILVGSAAEKLDVTPCDQMSSGKLQTRFERDFKLLSYMPLPHGIVASGEDVHEDSDIIIDTRGVSEGYLRLRPSSTVIHKEHVMWYEKCTPYLKRSRLPANTNVEDSDASIEIRSAYKCDFWPEGTSEWISRERPADWPKPHAMEQVINKGCEIIAETHPNSTMPDIEFRFTFAQAEKLLFKRFVGEHQLYCCRIFLLLGKFCLKSIPTITTYHLKTIFLYAMEILPRRIWRLKPGVAVLYLITRLLSCMKTRVLPHYFISSSNLISHFTEEKCEQAVDRLLSLREFPMTWIILLAEEYNLSSTWMADPVIEDVRTFLSTTDLEGSVFKVFIPTSLKLAESYAKYNMFKLATSIADEAYDDMGLILSTNDTPNTLPDIFHFLKPLLSSLTYHEQWWFCFFLDLWYELDTIDFLTENESGKTIVEIVEDKESEERIGHVIVPYQILHPLHHHTCEHACHHQEAVTEYAELNFLVILTMNLFHQEEYDLSAHYYRSTLRIIRNTIDELLNSAQPAQDKHKKQTYLIDVQYQTLINLFHSYRYQHKTELFQEYVQDLENACDLLATPNHYQNLANVYTYLGSHEMSQKVLQKKRNLFS